MELPRSFISHPGWLQEGTPDDELVISSRIRLARNFEGLPFSQWASSTDLRRISQDVQRAVNDSPLIHDASFYCMEELGDLDRSFLCERYLVSRELAKSGIERHVAIKPHQNVSIMVNEEDHIRLQMLMAGPNLQAAWETINEIDSQLENSLDYSFSNTLGYLTACPTNVGTGIRCSVMVHLPGLVLTREIERVLNAVTQIGLAVRGISGEGSEIAGNLFQISNQWTLGISEKDTIAKIQKILNQIIQQEKKAQQSLLETKQVKLEDQIWRAYAALRYARVLNSGEALDLLSSIRLGRNVGILDKPSYPSINQMLIQLRPAHIQKKADKELSSQERDMYRAELMRNWVETGLTGFN